MEALARTVISLIDLAEAEGRLVRRALVRLVITIAMVAMIFACALVGLYWINAGVFAFLNHHLGLPFASLITGLIWLGLGSTLAAIVRRRNAL